MALHILNKRLLASCLRQKYRGFNVSAVSNKIVHFLLSDIGEGIREVTVSEWYVKEGDRVAQFDNICSVESDKASVSITSRYDGVVKKIYYELGEKALVGKPLVDIDTDEADDSSSDEPTSSTEATVRDEAVVPTQIVQDETIVANVSKKALATPAVRRIAAQYDIRLSDVKGTGKSGRVLKEDLLNLINDKTSGSQDVITASPADVTPITGIKKVMFNTMTQSNLIPSFNYYEEINVSNLIRLKEEVKTKAAESGLKLTFTPFFMKALSKALSRFPELNSSLDANNENIISNKNHNIGFAVDTKNGLVVPNVKNVESLSIVGIAKELDRILDKGRQGLFEPHDLKGGTITISNVGMIGGTYTRPLILPPELVIVALGKIAKRPAFNDNNELISSDILYSSWTADHRVIDGATLARFVTQWKYYLENPSALLLDL